MFCPSAGPPQPDVSAHRERTPAETGLCSVYPPFPIREASVFPDTIGASEEAPRLLHRIWRLRHAARRVHVAQRDVIDQSHALRRGVRAASCLLLFSICYLGPEVALPDGGRPATRRRLRLTTDVCECPLRARHSHTYCEGELVIFLSLLRIHGQPLFFTLCGAAGTKKPRLSETRFNSQS